MVMRPKVACTSCATSSREQTDYIITFTQVEQGKILSESRNDAEIGEESDNESIMMSKQYINDITSGDESDHDLIYTEMI